MAEKRKILSAFLPGAAAIWLGLCHSAPYIEGTHPVGTLFGMAPPLLLIAPPICVLIVLGFRVLLRREVGRNLVTALGIAAATIPLLSPQWSGARGAGADGTILAMTFNVEKSSRRMPELLAYLKENRVDILFLQENKGGDESPASYLQGSLAGWHMASAGEVAILSRWPLEDVRSIETKTGDGRQMLLADIAGPRRFRAMTVHWSVPQFSKGLRAMRNGAVRQSLDYEQTLEAAREGDLPLLLGGDFNNPPRHAFTHDLSRRFENCFSTRGAGLGWTYPSGKPWTRIDHLYVARGLETLGAKVGPNLGSDHLPLLAKVAFQR
ncbi:hypothetical protein EON79_10325 [bacterium]|nr:MAG: hypothetical protein EON79_10325 [bacterium]